MNQGTKLIQRELRGILLCSGLLASGTMLLAQNRTLTGNVKDVNGDPIIGANVVINGTKTGTVTNLDGTFSLTDVPESATITISYIGYEDASVNVRGKNTINVVLSEDSEMLEEMVVVGYGMIKKSNVVGSIAKITSESLENRPVSRVEQALQGQMAGVSVRSTSGSPGSDILIAVRGAASINGESTPLYVIDGVPTESLSGVNPSDIASIDVLKDAASAAIYGSRGSNGVVLVTTKRGKTGRPLIQLNAYAAVSTAERHVDVMNSEEWLQFNKKWYDRQWVNATGLSASASQSERIAYAEKETGKSYATRDALNGIRSSYGIYDPYWSTGELEAIDWQDEIFRSAPQYDVELSASGASDKINYNISGGVFKQDGIVVGSDFSRYSLRCNLESQLTSVVKIGIKVAPTYGIQNGPNVEGKSSAVATSLEKPGWVLAGSGRMAGAKPTKYYGEWGPGPNNVSPYVMATVPERKTENTRINSSLDADIRILESLHLTGMVAWNYRSQMQRSYTPTWGQAKWNTASHEGELSTSNYNTLISHTLLYQTVMNYNKEFGKIHSINAMLGASLETYKVNTSQQQQSNFSSDKTWVFTKDSGNTTKYNEINYNENALLSYFGRIQYSLMDRYLMMVSLRRDGSSKFGKNNRWGWFPSASAAWKINEESFVRDIDWIGTAKLRLSWGKAGNDRIGNAEFLSNMSALNYALGPGQNLNYGYVIGNIANSNLGWETTTSMNVGVDFGVLRDRILLNVDYYRKTTDDLLLKAPVSLITGFGNMMDNVGSVDNWGMEFELNTVNVDQRKFKWNTSLNISFNRNEITSLGSDDSDIRSGQGSTTIQRVGYPINSYMLLRVERTLRADDFEADGVTPKPGIAIYKGQKAGDTKWTDVNNDGVITSDDYDVVGSYEPDFEWGLTNTFKYGNFDASIMLQGRVGGDLLSIGSRSWNRATNDPRYNYMSRWLTDAYWSEEEPGDGTTPAFYAKVTGGQYDTNWLYDAGYVRIKNITIGYNFDFKSAYISRLRIYGSCDNVYMWDNYDPGFSPEAATQTNNSADWGSYPQARTLSFGVNLTF